MSMHNTQEKFVHELEDVYDAEHQFLKAMEELSQQASDSTLQQLVKRHIGETQEQIKTLEQVFSFLDEKPKRQFCDGAKGIITEGQKTLKEAQQPELKDCVIGGSLEKSEHYEIASYSGLKTDAQALGQTKIVQLIDKIFVQEQKMADELEKSAPKLVEKAGKAQPVKA
jgi:ferritin-like metal-binding protein YciE